MRIQIRKVQHKESCTKTFKSKKIECIKYLLTQSMCANVLNHVSFNGICSHDLHLLVRHPPYCSPAATLLPPYTDGFALKLATVKISLPLGC